MKKLLLLFLLLVPQFLHAQDEDDEETEKKVPKRSLGFYDKDYANRNSGSFGKGTNLITLGYGIATVQGNKIDNYGLTVLTTNGTIDLTGYIRSQNTGPFCIQYEGAIGKEWGLCLSMSYLTSKMIWDKGSLLTDYNYVGPYFNGQLSTIGGLAVVNYHFNKIIEDKNLDFYVGAGVGAAQINFQNFIVAPDPITNVELALQVGLRYYIGSGIAINTTWGSAMTSWGLAGITFRINGHHHSHIGSSGDYNKNKVIIDDDDKEEEDDADETPQQQTKSKPKTKR